MARRIQVSDLRPADRQAATVRWSCACDKCPCVQGVIGAGVVCASCAQKCR